MMLLATGDYSSHDALLLLAPGDYTSHEALLHLKARHVQQQVRVFLQKLSRPIVGHQAAGGGFTAALPVRQMGGSGGEVSVGGGQRLLQDGQHHCALLRNTGLHLQRDESLVPGTTGWGFPPQSEDPTCAQHGGVAH